jgi:hypothetical protein
MLSTAGAAFKSELEALFTQQVHKQWLRRIKYVGTRFVAMHWLVGEDVFGFSMIFTCGII